MKLRNLLEVEYGVHDLLTQHMDQIKLDSGPRTYRMLQTQLTLGKDAWVENWLKTNGYVEDPDDAPPNDKALPFEEQIKNVIKKEIDECWKSYKQVGMKKKGDRMVPNCVKEDVDIYYEENGKGYGYTFEFITDKSLQEAEYQGRKVKLNKIMQGDAKKFKVYVKNPKGNVVKVNFGQGGKAKGGTMRIRKSNPNARKNFRARHNCDNPGPKHKARYWACRTW